MLRMLPSVRLFSDFSTFITFIFTQRTIFFFFFLVTQAHSFYLWAQMFHSMLSILGFQHLKIKHLR